MTTGRKIFLFTTAMGLVFTAWLGTAQALRRKCRRLMRSQRPKKIEHVFSHLRYLADLVAFRPKGAPVHRFPLRHLVETVAKPANVAPVVSGDAKKSPATVSVAAKTLP